MKIVVVEDEILIREGIVNLIKKFYHHNSEIREASCGKEGLVIIRNFLPDIVITDIRMKPVSGLEMLNILLTQDKLNFKVIILSAYSEFEYAKQAISLGVFEYIVKPVDINEFQSILRRLENEIVNDTLIRHGNTSLFSSVESILYGLLLNRIEFNHEVEKHLTNKYSIASNCPIMILYIYLGKIGKEIFDSALQTVQKVLANNCNVENSILSFPEKNSVLCVFFNINNIKYLEHYINNTIMKKINSIVPYTPVFIFDYLKGMESINDSFENLKKNLHWNISLGKEYVINVNELKKKKGIAASYPIQIEQDTISMLCDEDHDGFSKQVLLFIRFFSDNHYTPDSIKKCCIRYFITILNIIKELNYAAYETIDEQTILEEIRSAKTAIELENTLSKLLTSPIYNKNELEIGNIVKKVLRIVEEYYKNGITLKEVANKLSLSPDYISVQFTNEIGINFSTYIKNYRLDKAKKLLIGTELKIYEIAHNTGYTDAKYFSRVFMEEEGIHPIDYRKKYR